MDTWGEIGTVAAVIAAGAGAGALGVSWMYGRRSDRNSTAAVRYERLREAREFVGRIQVTGDNTRWTECSDACAQLRGVLVSLTDDLPETKQLAGVTWNMETYMSERFPERVNAARREIDAAVAGLKS